MLFISTVILVLIICGLILLVLAYMYPHQAGQFYTTLLPVAKYPYYEVPDSLLYLQTEKQLTTTCNKIIQVYHDNYLQQHYQPDDQDFYTGWSFIALHFYHRSYYQEHINKYPSLKAEFTYLQELLYRPYIVSASISLLAPYKNITPHSNPFSGVLRYQLPLLTDGKCTITVDGHTHTYQQGQAFIFDDYLTHSVTNHSDKPRLALLLDLARPYEKNWQSLINSFTLHSLGYLLPISS